MIQKMKRTMKWVKHLRQVLLHECVALHQPMNPPTYSIDVVHIPHSTFIIAKEQHMQLFRFYLCLFKKKKHNKRKEIHIQNKVNISSANELREWNVLSLWLYKLAVFVLLLSVQFGSWCHEGVKCIPCKIVIASANYMCCGNISH